MLILILGLLPSTRLGIMAQIACMGEYPTYIFIQHSTLLMPTQCQPWGLVCS
jgi:hypothetical protein